MKRQPIRHADIMVEKLVSGGWLLSVIHDGRRIASRHFDYTLREAKSRFIADIKAGAV